MADLLRPSRRGFLIAAASLLAAPAIVRVASIMPVKAIDDRIAVNLGGGAWWLEGDDMLVKQMLHEMMNRQSEALAQAFRASVDRAYDRDLPGHVLSADAFINLPSTY